MDRRFRSVDRDQLFLMPPDVRDWLPVGHEARFLSAVVEQFDLSAFVEKNESSRDHGRPAYHPVVMVGIVLYAAMCSVNSSRRIARLLSTDVGFRVVAANETPDHSTISRFLIRYGPELDGLFARVVGLAGEAGLVDPTLVAVDGTKMGADASMSANVTMEKLRAKYRDWLELIEATDAAEDAEDDGSGPIPEMGDEATMRAWIQDHLDELADTDRVNRTDPDSGLLPRSGGGWVQGYNAQAGAVEGGIVVAGDVTSSPVDSTMLVSMAAQVADQIMAATGEHAGLLVADAGYWSTGEIDVVEADDDLPDVLIATGRAKIDEPPEPLGEPDPATVAAHDQAVADYQAALDAETARRVPVIGRVVNGELLLREAAEQLGLSVPRVGELKLDWIAGGGPEAITVTRLPDLARPTAPPGPTRAARARHTMEVRLGSPAGKSMYRQRQAIIEPVFGDVKTNRRITRFLRRGIDKVRTDWNLILTGHNLTILHQRG